MKDIVDMEKINKEDLIRRNDAIDAIKVAQVKDDGTYSWRTQRNLDLEFAVELLEALPSVEPKHGKWYIENNSLVVLDVCDQCMKSVRHVAPFYNFCPHCGADMR